MARDDTAAAAMTHPDGTPITVLVVDDETSISDLLSAVLRYEGCTVHSAHTGTQALQEFMSLRPDVVILDIMLPDMDGLEILRRMRQENPSVPVLFLTARDSVEDRVAGLTAGGDDYVTKPFSLEEVIARVRALLRRAVPLERDPSLTVGELVLNEETHQVFRGESLIQLTATEFELLRYLMCHPQKVLSKAQILDRVWKYDFGGHANVVELYISYLRKKIDSGRAPMIHTIRGAGYILKPAP
jgi:two-component system, OmpR family, response regulator